MAGARTRQARLFRIEGLVQGVFFRRSAQIEAERLGLAGWVRNLDDGRVEAYACGPGELLDRFEHWLGRGPRHAVVKAVVAIPAAVETASGFDVR